MPEQKDSLYYHVIAEDGGPIYVETNLDHFIAEPFNAVSAFLFILLVGYWFKKVHGNYNRHTFLAIALPILLIGGVGGTLYHAFRTSEVFLVMDWLPIFLLTIAATAYYLFRVLKKWRYMLMAVGGILLLELINFEIFEAYRIYSAHTATNVSYAVVAIATVASVYLLLSQTKFQHTRWIGFAVGAFLCALFFRIADPWALLPVGTHFLWHSFGALACHFLLQYTYLLNEVPFRKANFTEQVRRIEIPDVESKPGSAEGQKRDSEKPSGYREGQR